MANDVKRKNQPSFEPPRPQSDPTTPARLTVLACVVALAALLTQVPTPAQVLDVLTDAAAVPTSPSAPLAAVQSILLTTAGLLAWLIAAWAIVVLGLGLIARLPGRSGRRARRVLPRIAPASVGRLVLAAVGVSLIAGTAACAAPDTAVRAADRTTVGATAAVSTPSAPSTAGMSPTLPPTGSFTIDWPDPSLDPAGPQTPAPPAATTPAPTTPAPTTPAPTTSSPTAAASTTPAPTTSSPTAAAIPPTTEPAPVATPAPVAAAGSPATPEPAAPAAPPTGSTPSANVPPAEHPVPASRSGAVTVRPGDCLWRIAATALGPDATDSEVDNAWRVWYFVNREVIGADPDTILPGQSLQVPSTTEVRS